VIGAFESEARILFHANVNKAWNAAIQEAAITNGLVQQVISIKITLNEVYFIGKVNRSLFLSRFTNYINFETPYISINVTYSGNYHTTWDNIIGKTAPFGYLVFLFPVDINYEGKLFTSDCGPGNDVIVNIKFNRCGESLADKIYGETLCSNCGKPIDPKRLLAIPGTLYCTQCMKFIEKGGYGNGKPY
jgi:hypothetical protein